MAVNLKIKKILDDDYFDVQNEGFPEKIQIKEEAKRSFKMKYGDKEYDQLYPKIDDVWAQIRDLVDFD